MYIHGAVPEIQKAASLSRVAAFLLRGFGFDYWLRAAFAVSIT